MGGMFSHCKKLVNLDLSNFNTNNCVYMYKIFENCESLYNLDISSFNCNNKKASFQGGLFGFGGLFVDDDLFKGCKSLTNIKVSYKDYKNPDFIRDLKTNCKSLQSVKVKH